MQQSLGDWKYQWILLVKILDPMAAIVVYFLNS